MDPDDLTPTAIKKAGADIVTYGASALPGAMFMMAYLDDTPILGVPACGMFFRTTVVDLLLPRVLRRRKDYKARHYQLRRWRPLYAVRRLRMAKVHIWKVNFRTGNLNPVRRTADGFLNKIK